MENFDLRIHEINGGSLRNAIPRESKATVVINTISKEPFFFEINELINDIKAEYKSIEPNLSITITDDETPNTVMEYGAQEGFIKSMYAALNGVYRMSPDIDGLVETSNNIAKVVVKEGHISVSCLTRSSSESNKTDVSNSLCAAFELSGFDVEYSGSYPGWLPNIDSEILHVLDTLYEKLHGEKAKIAACHAGLECGILGQNYPEIDMVSFGPTILGAHSPDEKASISSTQKFWKFLLEILKNIPNKA
jgi:dipeptidase D